ncbi:hypothetical protein BKA70DRAFT_783047 [Coprinopsis sp. MPI-PUGE-AT-0042]|nr:hypothetical protein BKA70DRAFT_783047 [Coprinopsis sp. MPI-PUGE-AT-0042]
MKSTSAMLLNARNSPNAQSRSAPYFLADQKDKETHGEEASSEPVPRLIPRLRPRTVAPFVAAHDIPRGILHAFQAALMYLLMLAVMSYRVEWIVCIIVGLGVGEILFGRYGDGSAH